MDLSKSVDEFIIKNSKWKDCLIVLRDIMKSTEMEETVKWGMPVYTLNKKNVVGIAAMKDWIAIWFHMGALLSDPHRKLINAQEGVTKAQRQWRLSTMDEIVGAENTIREYVLEAIENQKAGKEIKPQKNKPLIVPEELISELESNPAAKKKFDTLKLTQQREFAEYIAEAKREETKSKRLAKIMPMILNDIGLNDKYRK